jgi:hypothetical protein
VDGVSAHLEPGQCRRYRNFAITIAAMFAGIGLAAVVYFLFHLTWLAVVLVAVSVPLRWLAMLLANADPPARHGR